MGVYTRGLLLFILLLLLIAAGCGEQPSPGRKPSPQNEQSQQPQVQINPDLSEKVKAVAKTVDGVEDSTAVVIDNSISTAVKVTGFDRLRLKSIKAQVHKKIKESNKDYKVHVTSDKKLFFQIQQIEGQIKDQKVESPENIKKRVEKINKNMQG